MRFNYHSPQKLIFGPGLFNTIFKVSRQYNQNCLILTGSGSFQKTDQFSDLLKTFKKSNKKLYIESITKEPSVDVIDCIVEQYRKTKIGIIISIGGGSVIDAGKAISAMIPQSKSVIHYLEGVGDTSHGGTKIPFIAIPTTAGTGSEATKNAVISQVSKHGFKKSLRHDNFIPDIAIVDPQLTLNCPPHVTAACGMDALTQLLESFVSTQASPMTDSLVMGALKALKDSLPQVMRAPNNIDLRSNISYASYISGLTLANAGLGVIHGFAATIGGQFDIPHGVVCGTLLAQVTQKNIQTLICTDPDGPALKKYGQAACLLDPLYSHKDSIQAAQHLGDLLANWQDQLNIPKLKPYGITPDDIDSIIAATGQKNNPCQLSVSDLSMILHDGL